MHRLPIGCDIDRLNQLVSSSWINYHIIMNILRWKILSSFNGCVSVSDGCLYSSIWRMNIVELVTYARKWCYFTLICFVLGLLTGSQANVSALMLSSNSLHMTVGETVPTLYPGAFIYFRISIIGMVLLSDWLSAMYSLSV